MWIKAIRKRYAPAHIAFCFSLAGDLLVVLAIVLRMTDQESGIRPIIPFLAAIVAINVGYYVGVCPTCKKSSLRRNWVKESSIFRPIAHTLRFLPERVCSDCGTRLDESPPAQRQAISETLP